MRMHTYGCIKDEGGKQMCAGNTITTSPLNVLQLFFLLFDFTQKYFPFVPSLFLFVFFKQIIFLSFQQLFWSTISVIRLNPFKKLILAEEHNSFVVLHILLKNPEESFHKKDHWFVKYRYNSWLYLYSYKGTCTHRYTADPTIDIYGT